MGPQFNRFWSPASLTLEETGVRLSRGALDEIRGLARRHAGAASVEEIPVRSEELPAAAAEVERFRSRLDDGCGIVLAAPAEGLDRRERRVATWTLSGLLGTPLVQNSEGMRLVHVWDRDRTRRMADGARYHQTREGGSIHTDNVNVPDPWHYLVFACLQPAMVGGESILVNALGVHAYLKEHVPDALRALEEPFWWEYRGIADRLYRAPVITYDDRGEPLFRYLRPYLEAAHRRAEEPLTERQAWALDVLDAVMDLSALQLRGRLRAGEILVTADSRILHGRTCFADHFDALPLDETPEDGPVPARRTFDRLWVQKP